MCPECCRDTLGSRVTLAHTGLACRIWLVQLLVTAYNESCVLLCSCHYCSRVIVSQGWLRYKELACCIWLVSPLVAAYRYSCVRLSSCFAACCLTSVLTRSKSPNTWKAQTLEVGERQDCWVSLFCRKQQQQQQQQQKLAAAIRTTATTTATMPATIMVTTAAAAAAKQQIWCGHCQHLLLHAAHAVQASGYIVGVPSEEGLLVWPHGGLPQVQSHGYVISTLLTCRMVEKIHSWF